MLLGVVVVIHQILGFIWYSPLLFGKFWQNNIGVDIDKLQEYTGATPFLVSIAGSLLFCVVLCRLIDLTRSYSIEAGIKLSVLLWVGVAFTTLTVHYSFLGLSKIIFVDAGKDLIGMIIAGGILGSAADT